MSSRHYLCQFHIQNFTYVYRCRAEDQYCCGYTCCFKSLAPDQGSALITSWYFWSLISLVLIVFGCIILSFTLSSLKRKSRSRATTDWLGLMSGSANLSNLATTTVGQSGIIQPNIFYKEKKLGDLKTAASSTTAQHDDPDAYIISEASPHSEVGLKNYDAHHLNPLKPLSAAYRSAWNGEGPIELRLSNGQSILPPGFINS